MNKETRYEQGVSIQEVERAAHSACRHHMHKADVQQYMEDWDGCNALVRDMINSGTYCEHLHYTPLEKTGKSGKRRHIEQPSLVTRILQYVFMHRVEPLYDRLDNKSGLNCKRGCGLNAAAGRLSVRHRVKGMMYDRRDIHWLAIADQRKCYEHVRERTLRRALKQIGCDRWLTDYGCAVTMTKGRLPIGTPVSPLAHHILMVWFDRDMSRDYPFYIRYADNVLIGCNSRDEARGALWRVRQRWWYELGIRANRRDSCVTAADGTAVDFCGTVYRRNADKGYDDHNKGYCTARRRTAAAARHATAANWPCYYGQLKGIDTYNLMQSIERRNMKLAELTRRIRIDRKMDAPQVQPRDIAGMTIDVLEYEIRQNGKGQDNWLKLLVSYGETDSGGQPTGRTAVREMHGDYQGLIAYLRALEKGMGGSGAFMPIEDARIVNSCGYIFEGSTNQMLYAEDYERAKPQGGRQPWG